MSLPRLVIKRQIDRALFRDFRLHGLNLVRPTRLGNPQPQGTEHPDPGEDQHISAREAWIKWLGSLAQQGGFNRVGIHGNSPEGIHAIAKTNQSFKVIAHAWKGNFPQKGEKGDSHALFTPFLGRIFTLAEVLHFKKGSDGRGRKRDEPETFCG